MYYFYMDKVLLPIPPSKIQITKNNKNETINLINEGEVNVIKSPGLTSIKFDILLPLYTRYPFAMYKDIFLPGSFFLEYFKVLKNNGIPFYFVVNRYRYDPDVKAKRNVLKSRMQVILEDYTITESSDSAPDIEVSIELKEYIKYGTIIKEVDTKTNTVKSSTIKSTSTKSIPNTYTVKKGDTLWAIAKKLLGDGAKCWNLAKLNGISNPNKLTVGQVLKIQDVKATTAPASSSVTSSTKTVKTVTPASAKTSTIPKSSFLYADSEKTKNAIAEFLTGVDSIPKLMPTWTDFITK